MTSWKPFLKTHSWERPITSPSINPRSLRLLDFRSFRLRFLAGLIKLGLHRGVATGEALDGEVVGLVVSQTEVVLGTN